MIRFACLELVQGMVKLSELVSLKLQLKENLNGTSCVLKYEVSLRNLLGISARHFFKNALIKIYVHIGTSS